MRDLGVARSDKRRSRDKGKQENRERSCATQENRQRCDAGKEACSSRKAEKQASGRRGIFDLWKLTRADCAINRRRKKTGKQANCSNNGMKRERLRETGRGRRTRKQRKRQLVGFFKEWGLSFQTKIKMCEQTKQKNKNKKGWN